MSTRGRPVDPDKQVEQRQVLLDAARVLIAEKGYRTVTIREIGEKAGINPAMIRYYFENKEGLFIALIETMANRHFAQVASVGFQPMPLLSLITNLLEMLANNSGIARLIHDEILQNDSPLRQAFIERFPKRMAEFLPKLIQQQLGVVDPLAAKYLAFNLMSMILMPFIAEPVRDLAWQIQESEITDPKWAKHLHDFLVAGSRIYQTDSSIPVAGEV